MNLRTIIVDDEENARKNLHLLLEEFCPEAEIIGEAGNIEDAKVIIESSQPDVVFLDIRMPSGAEGFDLLDNIEEQNFFVVFVTAFKDFAVRAFNANAVHYVLKPVDIEDLQEAVAKLIEAKKIFSDNPANYSTYFQSLKNLSDELVRNKPSNRIAISHTKGIKIVEDDSIVHLEANGNCTQIYFKDGTRYLDTRTLKIYESILDKAKFFRTHKSHIVNLSLLTDYVNDDGHFAVLNGNLRIPVARNRVSSFVKVIKAV